jgi:hypothetical protein
MNETRLGLKCFVNVLLIYKVEYAKKLDMEVLGTADDEYVCLDTACNEYVCLGTAGDECVCLGTAGDEYVCLGTAGDKVFVRYCR